MTTDTLVNDANRTYFDSLQSLRDHGTDESLRVMAEGRRAHDMAMSYVWGYQDATTGGTDSNEALAFGAVYAMHTIDYETGCTCMRRPIVDSFRRWRAGEAIRTNMS